MAQPTEPIEDPAPVADHQDDAPLPSRRARFQRALADLAEGSSSDDLVRWMLVPGSVAVVLGFNVMLFGWIGAARTAREIEQIPYLISGGLVGLALVVLGGLLLASTFWVAVLRKLEAERATAEGAAADRGELAALRARIDELEAAGRPATPPRRRSSPRRTSTAKVTASKS